MTILKEIEYWGRERAMGVISRTLSTPQISARDAAERIEKNPTSKILLIGIYQKMGQFLCATPMIRSLATAWPKASFHFIGNPTNAEAAEANPHLDRVWIWNKSSLWHWPTQAQALRREHFDLAILLTTERPSATGVILARATGARWVAGYLPSVSGAWAEDIGALCHIRIPFNGERNEVSKFIGYSNAFGVAADGRELEYQSSPDDLQFASEHMAALPLKKNKPIVGLFIGGKQERSDRLWPVSHFATLANQLKQEGCEIVVLGPPPPQPDSGLKTYEPKEHLRLEEFRREVPSSCPVFQESSIGRVAAFLQKLDLLVCPDGGILHLAAAVKTPTLGLFFSTDPAVWQHERHQTVLDGRGKPSSDMLVETVAAEVIRLLGRKITA